MMNFNKLNKIISEDKKIQNDLKEAMNTPMPTETQKTNQNQNVSGNLNIQKLLKYFPNQDPVKFKNSISIAMRGGKLNNMQLMNLGNAFIDLLKANTNDTVQVMNLVKRVSMENNEGEK